MNNEQNGAKNAQNPQPVQGNQQAPQNQPVNQSTDQTPPEERNKKVLRSAGIILVIVIIVALAGNSIWKQKTPATPDVPALTTEVPEGCGDGALFSATTGKPCPQPTDTTADSGTAATAAAAAPSGYDEAISLYAGKVIVFDAACKPIPTNPSFAAGTRVLVANNSDQKLTLSLADKSKDLDPYHYFTVSLASAGSAVVSCNGAPAATVTVQ